jgi:hypothetical protein
VTRRPIARKRVDRQVSVEIDSLKTTCYGTRFREYEWSTKFPWIPIRCVIGRSDQNQVSRSWSLSQFRAEQRDQNGASPGQSFTVSYCDYEWLYKESNKTDHHIQNPVIISHADENMTMYRIYFRISNIVVRSMNHIKKTESESKIFLSLPWRVTSNSEPLFWSCCWCTSRIWRN